MDCRHTGLSDEEDRVRVRVSDGNMVESTAKIGSAVGEGIAN